MRLRIYVGCKEIWSYYTVFMYFVVYLVPTNMIAKNVANGRPCQDRFCLKTFKISRQNNFILNVKLYDKNLWPVYLWVQNLRRTEYQKHFSLHNVYLVSNIYDNLIIDTIMVIIFKYSPRLSTILSIMYINIDVSLCSFLYKEAKPVPASVLILLMLIV